MPLGTEYWMGWLHVVVWTRIYRILGWAGWMQSHLGMSRGLDFCADSYPPLWNSAWRPEALKWSERSAASPDVRGIGAPLFSFNIEFWTQFDLIFLCFQKQIGSAENQKPWFLSVFGKNRLFLENIFCWFYGIARQKKGLKLNITNTRFFRSKKDDFSK